MLAERALTAVTPTASGKIQWIVEGAEGPVGWITLDLDVDDRRHGNATVGYTIGERFRGRGYGSAALRAVLPFAFGRDLLALERLEAVAAVDNDASRRVLERNGFRFEGVLRPSRNVRLTAYRSRDLRSWRETLQEQGFRRVVLKDQNSTYSPGSSNESWVVVEKIREAGRR